MKTIKLIAVGIILFVSSSIQAQVSVNLNIGTAPSWGPSGYAAAAYYYLPDVQAYYDVRASLFVYFGDGSWIRSRYLPRQYRNYDLYNGYKIVLNRYHGNRPYAHYKNHRQHYSSNYSNHRQRTIGQRHDDRRYSNNRRYAGNHQNANNYKKQDNRRKYDNNNHHDNKENQCKGHHGKH